MELHKKKKGGYNHDCYYSNISVLNALFFTVSMLNVNVLAEVFLFQLHQSFVIPK